MDEHVRALALIVWALAQTPAGPPPASEAAPQDPGPIVDRVVARVDDAVITLSELRAETRLLLLDARNPLLALQAELTTPLLTSVLRSMVRRTLLLAELRRLQLRAAPDEDVARMVRRFESRFGNEAELAAFLHTIGLTDPDPELDPRLQVPRALVERVRQEVEVNRFLDVRVRLNVVVAPAEVRACFEANRARFPGQSYEQVAAQVRLRLTEQKEARALADVVEQLESRARIRLEPPFDAPEEAAAEDDKLGFSCPETVRGYLGPQEPAR